MTRSRRSVGTLLLLVLLTSWVGAQSPPPRLSGTDQARLLNRNRSLIVGIVDSGLKMSSLRSRGLERAGAMEPVVSQLSQEIQRAVKAGEKQRAAELTRHLNRLVERGMNPNLQSAFENTPIGTASRGDLVDLHQRTLRILDPVTGSLQEGDMTSAELLKTSQKAMRETVRDPK